MTKEYIKQLCEMLLKDNLTQNGKKKIVNYIEILQNRINKTLQIIKECKMLMPHEFDWEEQVDNIVSILQDEKVE